MAANSSAAEHDLHSLSVSCLAHSRLGTRLSTTSLTKQQLQPAPCLSRLREAAAAVHKITRFLEVVLIHLAAAGLI